MLFDDMAVQRIEPGLHRLLKLLQIHRALHALLNAPHLRLYRGDEFMAAFETAPLLNAGALNVLIQFLDAAVDVLEELGNRLLLALQPRAHFAHQPRHRLQRLRTVFLIHPLRQTLLSASVCSSSSRGSSSNWISISCKAGCGLAATCSTACGADGVTQPLQLTVQRIVHAARGQGQARNAAPQQVFHTQPLLFLVLDLLQAVVILLLPARGVEFTAHVLAPAVARVINGVSGRIL